MQLPKKKKDNLEFYNFEKKKKNDILTASRLIEKKEWSGQGGSGIRLMGVRWDGYIL